MHDIRAIRADPAAFDAAMARRGLPPASPDILAKDTERRAVQTALQEKQARRNALAQEVGAGEADAAQTPRLWKPRPRRCAATWKPWNGSAAALDEEMRAVLEGLPNMLDPDVPDGAGRNRQCRAWSSMASRAISASSRSSISSSARRWA